MQLDASCFPAFVALASILERPFVTYSGVGDRAFRISVLSNVIASPAWFALGTIANLSMSPYAHRMNANSFTVVLFVFGFQFCVKTLVIRVSARKPINAWCIFAGNGLSLALISSMFIALVSFNDYHPRLWTKMIGYVPHFSLLSYTVFIGILLLCVIQTLSSFLVKMRTPGEMENSNHENCQGNQVDT